MKNLLKTNTWVNYGVRYFLAACAGSFVGSVMRVAIKSEEKIGDKIVIAAGGLITSWVIGNALDEPFDKMLEEGEKEEAAESLELIYPKSEEEVSET